MVLQSYYNTVWKLSNFPGTMISRTYNQFRRPKKCHYDHYTFTCRYVKTLNFDFEYISALKNNKKSSQLKFRAPQIAKLPVFELQVIP